MALFRRVRRPTYSRSYAPDLLTRAFTGSYLARVALGPQVEARFLVWPEVIFCRLNCRAVDPARPTPIRVPNLNGSRLLETSMLGPQLNPAG
jgi:hypothetical protein